MRFLVDAFNAKSALILQRLLFLGIWKILILRSTNSVTRFLFFSTLFRLTFCDIARNIPVCQSIYQ